MTDTGYFVTSTGVSVTVSGMYVTVTGIYAILHVTFTGEIVTFTGVNVKLFLGKKNLMQSKSTNSHELKKHVGAIHSSNKLSLLQRKIANALLFNAYQNLLNHDEHKIHINHLCALIGYDSKDYKTIRESLINLLSTVIEWNLVDGDKVAEKSVWNASSIIADASIDGPICSYSYSNKMRELLYHPELYGKLNMLIQAKFKSNYGLALYENCVRYQNINQTPWIELDTFRKLMGVNDDKYPIFRDLKRRVVDKAISEVNEYSNIELEAQFKREQRKVVAIKFLISKKMLSLAQQEQTQPLLLHRLQRDYGLQNQQAEALLHQYSDEYILEKIHLIENSHSYREGKIQNLAIYLQKALEQDFQQAKTSKLVLETKKAELEKLSHQVEKQKELQLARRKRQDQAILQTYQELSDIEQKKMDRLFLKYLDGSLYSTIFERDGFKNLLVGDQFCLFIRNQYPEWLETIQHKQILEEPVE